MHACIHVHTSYASNTYYATDRQIDFIFLSHNTGTDLHTVYRYTA